MPHWPFFLRRAEAADEQAVIGLIDDDAATWLRTMGTFQWRTPWPTRADRDGRVRDAIAQHKTWICWDRQTAAATLTADLQHDPYWADARSMPAVYVHRLVVARRYAGMRLGGSLLDWAGRTASLAHGAHSIRISAWTDNHGLHQYYSGQGFTSRGFHADDGYPSRARFEKLTSVIPFAWPPLFSAPSRLDEP
jgi:hypothetical protein